MDGAARKFIRWEIGYSHFSVTEHPNRQPPFGANKINLSFVRLGFFLQDLEILSQQRLFIDLSFRRAPARRNPAPMRARFLPYGHDVARFAARNDKLSSQKRYFLSRKKMALKRMVKERAACGTG
jgi:hypothetical protein